VGGGFNLCLSVTTPNMHLAEGPAVSHDADGLYQNLLRPISALLVLTRYAS